MASNELTDNESELTKDEWKDIIEYYAYRTSYMCVKLDDINQMVGGRYSFHPVIGEKVARFIYQRFVRHSKKIEKHEYDNVKVENIHCVDVENESSSYRIHIYNRNRTEERRKAMWIFCGIFLKLPNGLGYTRVFYMPCKLQLYKFSNYIAKKFVQENKQMLFLLLFN